MSLPLWMPYAESEALDLSKSNIKIEPVSPPRVEYQTPYLNISPDYTRFVAATSPRLMPVYMQAGPSYVSYQDATHSRQEPSRYVQNQCVSSATTHHAASTSQYYRYPTPAPQTSPSSSSNGSSYVPASGVSSPSSSNCGVDAHPRPATLSPPESPPAVKQKTEALDENEEFLAFERNAMRAMALKNGGSLLGNNPRMRRTVHSTSQNAADDAYKTQRQRNNFAAKQSRDRRKLREIHLALKVTYLTNTVAKLKAQLASRHRGGCRCNQPSGSSK